jgi:chemotaxis methyl-accepting protein methylase
MSTAPLSKNLSRFLRNCAMRTFELMGREIESQQSPTTATFFCASIKCPRGSFLRSKKLFTTVPKYLQLVNNSMDWSCYRKT